MRLVSIAPSNTRTIQELGREEDLVGTTFFSPLETEKVGGWTSVNCDAVADLEPDLVLACDRLQQEAVNELRDRGLEVIHLKPRTLEDVLDSFLEIGRVVGEPQEAENLVEDFRQTLCEVSLEGKIYCEEWSNPPMAAGNWVPGLIERGGGDYILRRGERSREVTASEVREFDPDHIIMNICGAGNRISTDGLKSREGWQEIPALRRGDIHVLDDSLLNQPSPKLAEGLKRIESIVQR